MLNVNLGNKTLLKTTVCLWWKSPMEWLTGSDMDFIPNVGAFPNDKY